MRASASVTASLNERVGPEVARPMLQPSWWMPKSVTTGSSNRRRIRLPTASMARSSPSGRITTNSSPPQRASVASPSIARRSRPATATSTSSPAAWPYRSLTPLNPSRSRKAIAERRPVSSLSSAMTAFARLRLWSPVNSSCSAWWRSRSSTLPRISRSALSSAARRSMLRATSPISSWARSSMREERLPSVMRWAAVARRWRRRAIGCRQNSQPAKMQSTVARAASWIARRPCTSGATASASSIFTTRPQPVAGIVSRARMESTSR